MPQPELLSESSKATGVPLDKLLTALNRKLVAYLDRDHQIGHSYLMNLETVADLRFAWEHKVMPLLQEYFYGDGEKLQLMLGPEFVKHTTIKVGNAHDADERVVYTLKTPEPDASFTDALNRLATS